MQNHTEPNSARFKHLHDSFNFLTDAAHPNRTKQSLVWFLVHLGFILVSSDFSVFRYTSLLVDFMSSGMIEIAIILYAGISLFVVKSTMKSMHSNILMVGFSNLINFVQIIYRKKRSRVFFT